MNFSNLKNIYYFLLFITNINAEEIIHITKAPMISEISFCEIPIKRSTTIITKKKIYAIVSMGGDKIDKEVVSM
jgi:hypothetical protein